MTSDDDPGTDRIRALTPDQRRLLELRLKQGSRKPEAPSITPRRDRSWAPLAPDQERLWLIDQMIPGLAAFNVSYSKLITDVDLPALETAIAEIIRRHESLRTTFQWAGDRPMQRIHEPGEFPFVLKIVNSPDLPDAEQRKKLGAIATELCNAPFDLNAEPPIRASILRCDSANHVLLVTIHHILADNISMRIFAREMSVLYEAFSSGKTSPLPELTVQYGDFAAWQHEYLKDQRLEKLLAYWERQLKGAPLLLALPTDWPRPAAQTLQGKRRYFSIPRSLHDKLMILAEAERVSPFIFYLSIFGLLLHRYSGQQSFLVGSPFSNRDQKEIRGLIGYLLNMLPLLIDLEGNPGFREMLGRVRRVAYGAFANHDLPFGKLLELLDPPVDLSRNPILQNGFIFLDGDDQPGESSGQDVFSNRDIDFHGSRFDLTLAITISSESFRGFFEYSSDLWDKSSIDRMVGHLQQCLESLAVNPDYRVAEIPLLPESERQTLLEHWNPASTDYPREQTIHGLFEQQVAQTPNAPAVDFEEKTLNYTQLNSQANQLARYLQTKGVGTGVIVAICVERSVEMIVGLLAILKAGGAYLPLDRDYPIERLNHMLEDSGAELLLSKGSLPAGLVTAGRQVICVDRDAATIATQDVANPASGTTAEDFAYVIYTSGSTGKPRGVMGLHRGLLNRLHWGWAAYPYQADERCCQKTTLSFVDSIAEIFSPLLAGLNLVILDEKTVRDVRALAQQVSSRGVTRLLVVPSLLRALLDLDQETVDGLECVRYWMTSGERLEPVLEGMLRARFADAVLLNFYGSSEVAADATCFDTAERGERGGSLIGRPIANTRLYVLDDWMNPVPLGMPGELYVGGDGLARGYLNRPELTAEKFVSDPFREEPGARLYRTGDRVRYLADGSLEYLGRSDDQVKLRGFRIEPGEIEMALVEQESIRDAVVMLREEDTGDKQLVGYVVPTREWIEQNLGSGENALASQMADECLAQKLIPDVRQQLRLQLPVYMLPTAFVVLETLPLTRSGKFDRAALTPGNAVARIATKYVEARTDLERLLAGIWAEVLKIERVGIHDNFFDLGGHSLMATQVMSRIHKHLRVGLPVAELFICPTLAELAQHIESVHLNQGVVVDEIEPIERVDVEIDSEDLKALSDSQVAELLSKLSRVDKD